MMHRTRSTQCSELAGARWDSSPRASAMRCREEPAGGLVAGNRLFGVRIHGRRYVASGERPERDEVGARGPAGPECSVTLAPLDTRESGSDVDRGQEAGRFHRRGRLWR